MVDHIDSDWGSQVIQFEQNLSHKVRSLNLQRCSSECGATTIFSLHPSTPSGKSATDITLSNNGMTYKTSPQNSAFASDLSQRRVKFVSDGGDASCWRESRHEKDKDEKDVKEVQLKMEEESLLQKLLNQQLLTSNVDLEVLRKDPNSPLHSVKTFDALNLKPELEKGVYHMNFNTPSKIQETALPALLADPPVNMIAQSQSGTGKTAAFVLTMLSRVDTSQHYPQCMCLAPTYELALQIGEVVTRMSKFMPDLRIRYATRGEKVMQGEVLTDHIIIGTPGTVLDWVNRGRSFHPDRLKVFVLDEADVMISMQGHLDQTKRIQRKLSKDCQMLLFSATYDETVMTFAQKVIHGDPVIIRLRREEESLTNVRQYYIECGSDEDKYHALVNIYGSISIGQSMIFCQKRSTASWLAWKMQEDRHAVALLSGELSIDQRAAIIQRFRQGKEKVLITTNISARGIDVVTVTVVVNFDLPMTHNMKPDCKTYLHRIGRTGRFGKTGIAINMVDSPQSLAVLQAVEKHFGRRIQKLNSEDLDEIEQSCS